MRFAAGLRLSRLVIIWLWPVWATASQADDARRGAAAFVGRYQLVEARWGLLCETYLQGFLFAEDSSIEQLDLGPWFFPRIDRGSQIYEDELVRSEFESRTTGDDRITYRSRDLSKVDGTISTSRRTATLHDGHLTIVSAGHFANPGDGTYGDTYSECVYRRL